MDERPICGEAMNARALRAAYDFLKGSAFYDIPLPPKIVLKLRKLKGAYGYYYSEPHRIEIDASVTDPMMFLRVVAHEMVHASLEQAAACDHDRHDENFNQLARIVCERMRWPMKGF